MVQWQMGWCALVLCNSFSGRLKHGGVWPSTGLFAPDLIVRGLWGGLVSEAHNTKFKIVHSEIDLGTSACAANSARQVIMLSTKK